MTKRVWAQLGGSMGVLVVIFLALWSWVLLTAQPLTNPVARAGVWPVACTVRGCITINTWLQQQQVAAHYATSFQQTAPSAAVTLTTVIRQKLIQDATVKSAVTLTDAQKYRQEILHLADEAAIKERTGLSSTEYDELVVLPFLEQEALRQQRRAESVNDVYKQLASERWVVVPLRTLRWDKETGQVVPR